MLVEALIERPSNTRHTFSYIVIGSGPVGIRAVQELIKQNPNRHIAIFGDEPWQPYNRVKLSSLISGEIKEDSLFTNTDFANNPFIHTFYNNRIIDINRHTKEIIDSQGKKYHYSKLILATGSTPRIPTIEGISRKNIFTFRDLNDAQNLAVRSVRTRKTVVIGGGLLGLEAARAMQRFNTDVTVIEHNMWLMFNQLDSHAASYLKKHIESLDIDIRTNTYVKNIIGDRHIKSIILNSGEEIECDTLIIATGISPNIELARDAGLSINRGIRVNDYLQTNDKDIYAIGECAEHRNKVYGLVSPGFEQASIVSYNTKSHKATYSGSIAATNLKVINYPVFSIGNTGDQARSREMFSYHDAGKGIYRKIIVINGRIRGAIAVGEMRGLNRLQEAVINERKIWFWQINRFLKEGYLWPDTESENVIDWPANAIICNCTGVTRSRLDEAKRAGAQSATELASITGASTVCGSCRHLVENFSGSDDPVEPLSAYRSIVTLSILIILLIGLLTLSGGIDYQSTAQTINWDLIWRSSLFKQISGFSLLTVAILISSISLRKRLPKVVKKWQYTSWRTVHIFSAILLFALLISHSGFRLGENLNLYLMLTFSGLLITGSLAALNLATGHLVARKLSLYFRRISTWGHILLLWPLPALLGFHILKTYYF